MIFKNSLGCSISVLVKFWVWNCEQKLFQQSYVCRVKWILNTSEKSSFGPLWNLKARKGGQVITLSCYWVTINDFPYYTPPEINYSSFPFYRKKTKTNKPHFGVSHVCMSSCPLRQNARPRVEAPVGEEKVSAFFLGRLLIAESLSTFNSLVPMC